MKETTEKVVGSAGEVYRIRIVEASATIIAEINLIYYDEADEKMVNLNNINFPKEKHVEEIMQETKNKIELYSIVKKLGDVDLFKS